MASLANTLKNGSIPITTEDGKIVGFFIYFTLTQRLELALLQFNSAKHHENPEVLVVAKARLDSICAAIKERGRVQLLKDFEGDEINQSLKLKVD